MVLDSTFGKSTLFHFLLGKSWGGYWRICFLGQLNILLECWEFISNILTLLVQGLLLWFCQYKSLKNFVGYHVFDSSQFYVPKATHTPFPERSFSLHTSLLVIWAHQANGNHVPTLCRRTFALMKSFRTVFFKISVIKDHGLFLILQLIIYFCKT